MELRIHVVVALGLVDSVVSSLMPGLSLLEARLLEKPFGYHAVGGPGHRAHHAVCCSGKLHLQSPTLWFQTFRGWLVSFVSSQRRIHVSEIFKELRLAGYRGILWILSPHTFSGESSLWKSDWTRAVCCWKIYECPSPAAKLLVQ